MTDTKKMTIEEGNQDSYKRMILEQGIQNEHVNDTPKWDAMKVSAKEGTAHTLTLFGKAFIGAIIPAFIVGVIIMTIIIIYVVGG